MYKFLKQSFREVNMAEHSTKSKREEKKKPQKSLKEKRKEKKENHK